jgi:hypothetical protein
MKQTTADKLHVLENNVGNIQYLRDCMKQDSINGDREGNVSLEAMLDFVSKQGIVFFEMCEALNGAIKND